jgi:hypothetical protein
VAAENAAYHEESSPNVRHSWCSRFRMVRNQMLVSCINEVSQDYLGGNEEECNKISHNIMQTSTARTQSRFFQKQQLSMFDKVA